MKLTIKSHSIRFRINAEDLAVLNTEGQLIQETHIPRSNGETSVFQYGVIHQADAEMSDLVFQPGSMVLSLCGSDFAQLNNFEKDGVYIRREWMSDAGTTIRFVAYIERDKKKDKHKNHDSSHHDSAPSDSNADDLTEDIH